MYISMVGSNIWRCQVWTDGQVREFMIGTTRVYTHINLLVDRCGYVASTLHTKHLDDSSCDTFIMKLMSSAIKLVSRES